MIKSFKFSATRKWCFLVTDGLFGRKVSACDFPWTYGHLAKGTSTIHPSANVSVTARENGQPNTHKKAFRKRGSEIRPPSAISLVQYIPYEPSEKTEEAMCDLLKQRTPGWSDEIFSHCKLIANHEDEFKFTIEVDEEKLPPTVKGMEGEEFLLNIVRLLHGGKNPCYISAGFAKDTSREAQNTMLVSTDEPGDLCDVVKGKTFRGITVSDCQLTTVTLSLEEIHLRTYKMTLSPDASWWRSMQFLLGLNRIMPKCRYNGHPTE
ncbi:hypothetical protein CSKR_113732 [Clonorchis sinensis]|uniref:Uncharacterized protein n=1 Tax=Clonorchis sinensis TaxID=79923 RepID=A0A419Q767_CLOSI|nr:hypothetical protein CSKR_113732 [Clonorchis sinensis]